MDASHAHQSARHRRWNDHLQFNRARADAIARELVRTPQFGGPDVMHAAATTGLPPSVAVYLLTLPQRVEELSRLGANISQAAAQGADASALLRQRDDAQRDLQSIVAVLGGHSRSAAGEATVPAAADRRRTEAAGAIAAVTAPDPVAAQRADQLSRDNVAMLTIRAPQALDRQQVNAHQQALEQHLLAASDGSADGMRQLIEHLRIDAGARQSLGAIARQLYAQQRAHQALPALIGTDIHRQLSPEQAAALESALAERLLMRTDGSAQGMTQYLQQQQSQRGAALELLEQSGAFDDPAPAPRRISLFGDPDFRLSSLQRAFGYMGDRVGGQVDRGLYPVYQPGMEQAGRDVPVGLRELTYVTPREDQPILNWVNRNVLQNPALKTLLRARGIADLQLTELGLRVGTTFPFDQRRQFVEIDDAVRTVRQGISRIATEIWQRDWAGVQAAWVQMLQSLNAASDQAFRPNRGTMSEGVQAPALDQMGMLGASTAAGLPGEAARSLFIEMSAKNNVESQGGTGGIVSDARSPSGFRLNVAYDNGQYVVLRPIVMKSILQIELLAQGAPAIPMGGGNLPLQSLLNPLQVPWVGFLPTVEVRSMAYVGENAGYWTIPAGARLTERQVALLNEGIVDPALFSQSGQASDDWRLLFRGFESDSIVGLNVRNRDDNLRSVAPQGSGDRPFQLRGDVEVGLGITISPLIGTPLAPFSKYFGLTPFRLGGGVVFKGTAFPQPPGVGRVITLTQDGRITEQTLRDAAAESRRGGLTVFRVPPELQDERHAGALNTVFVTLPSQAALVFAPNTGFSAQSVTPRWGAHSRAAVAAWLDAMAQSPADGVRAAAQQAQRVFAQQPAAHGSQFFEAQREALRHVLVAEIGRLLDAPATPRSSDTPAPSSPRNIDDAPDSDL